jgi:UDP:flavonoid glycosyltransferase YjiC (YdhE family)
VVWSNSLSQIFGGASFVVPAVVEAAARLGVELVLALSDEDADRLGPVPPSVTVLRRYPLNLLLTNASAVVHHGGAGCLMTAVAAGVPQLALPFGAEQEMIARRLAGSGAGTVIRGSAADPGSIAAALRDLLGTSGYRAAAESLAAENAAAPTPVALVAQLEALAARAEPALAAAP